MADFDPETAAGILYDYLSGKGINISDSRTFTNWFWTKSAAGQILKDIRNKCAAKEDRDLQMTGKMFLVPMGQ